MRNDNRNRFFFSSDSWISQRKSVTSVFGEKGHTQIKLTRSAIELIITA